MLLGLFDLAPTSLWLAVFLIAAAPIGWNVIARLEFYTHCFTKLMCGRKYWGCYLVAFYVFLFHVIRTGLRKVSDLTPQLITAFTLGLLVISMAHVTFSDLRNMLFLGVYIAMLYRYSTAGEGEEPLEAEVPNRAF